jgi:acetate kinase
MRIAVLNAGSASAKAALVEVDSRGTKLLGRGSREVPQGADHAAAFRAALDAAGAAAPGVDAVGHRVVHGGRAFSAPAPIDAEMEHAIEELSRLAQQHNPAALQGIRTARELFPDRPEVAVFDTAFHSRRPPESLRYALPWDLADSLGLFRYGFHGIAHASLVASVAQAQGGALESVTAVTLQLGAGCSACAVAGGESVETSMGFSPLEGLPMATRVGDVDPSVVLELLERGRTLAEVRELLTRRSGLAGLAGEADLRRVLAAEAAGSERARVALALFVRRIVTTVGAYLTLLGGRGAVVFGGGIGTHSAEIRRRVADGLAAWNVTLEEARNAQPNARGLISAPGTRPVYVFETDEERHIARSVYDLLTRASR